MDFGMGTLVYLVIGVIFVLTQVNRNFLGTGLAANQASEPGRIYSLPPVFIEPADFQRTKMATNEVVFPKSSFNDPGVRAVTYSNGLDKLPDVDYSFPTIYLLSAIVYPVILKRKCV